MNLWVNSGELLMDLDKEGREKKKVGRGRRWWSYGNEFACQRARMRNTANQSPYTQGLNA